MAMVTWIKLHETWAEGEKNNKKDGTPRVILNEKIITTEAEHYKIKAQYENRQGKYGMRNPSIDLCLWVPEDHFKTKK